MNILVTGGSGYVGSALVPVLLKNHKVRILDRLKSGIQPLVSYLPNPSFEVVRGDIRDEKVVSKALEGIDAVVHLAAIVGFPACKRDPWEAESINIGGTKNIVDKLGDRLIVYASTGSNYGEVDGVCTEDTPTKPLSLYGKTKTEGEKIVKTASNNIIYRFATAFGLSSKLRRDLLINDFVYQALKNKSLLVYEKENKRTFIHVSDMAKSFEFAIHNKDKMNGEVYNVGDESGNMTKEELVLLIRERLDFIYTFAGGWTDPDLRDYVVSYDKLKSLGYKTKVTVDQGIDELIKAYKVL